MDTEKEFEIIDHTADIGIRAYGADIKQVFQRSAKALFSLITDLDKVAEVLYRDIELAAPDRESLLVAWLNELIYLFDAEQILFRRFDISRLDGTGIKARIYGERVNKAKHELIRGVKAATYHMLKIEKSNGYIAQVLFDI